MYTPLKITTDYTLLNSLIKIDDLILFLLENNIKACGICDDNLYGAVEFYLKCKENNIKPIIGLSIILNDLEIYLYAKNYHGYQDLIDISIIKQERNIAIIDLEKVKDNILFIVPFKSIDNYKLLSGFDTYMAYRNEYEKNNCLLLTDKVLYVNDIKCLDVNNVRYLNALDLISEREKGDYHLNYYEKNITDLGKLEEVIAKLNVEIPLDKRYIPKYREDSEKFLFSLAHQGLKKRLKGNVPKAYLDRLNYELKVIKDMGFVDYFLIVYDYVLYAKKNNILVGCRGSAAGSLVSYSIGITSIDPLKYNLLFERFLNPARISMPDIDIDFDASRKDEVINYVINKYGVDNVAHGLTYATMKSKLVLRDVAKILKTNPIVFDRFIRVIDASKKLKENYQNEVVRKYISNYPEIKKLYQVAMHLESLKKNMSMHAAGIVISSVPLKEISAIYQVGEDKRIPLDYVEKLGLLKMDFLSLDNLTFIAKVLKHINNLDLDKINLNDKNVFAIFNNIDVDGIFQFETMAMRQVLQKFKIDSFNDLIAVLALARPGAKNYLDLYVARKKGKEKITYLHPSLEPILKETYGIILYQEQIMAILTKIGGYSLHEADLIRRAISKKKESIIVEEKKKFLVSSKENGYDEATATKIYDDISLFANYGFNKSHSVAYALLAYQMAYLKTYYYEYFMLERINAGTKDNIGDLLIEFKKKGIKINKPSLLNKNLDFVIENKVLSMPLRVIKGISRELASKINEVIPNNLNNYFDFFIKTKDLLNEDQIKVLIKAGALDFLGLNHPTLLNNMENALNYCDIAMDDLTNAPTIKEYLDDTGTLKNKEEMECFGFYALNHPTSIYQNGFVKAVDIKKYEFKRIKMALLVKHIKSLKTKQGENMAFIDAVDETGKVSLTVFAPNYPLIKDLKKEDVIIVLGQVSKRFDKLQIIVNNIKKDGEDNER